MATILPFCPSVLWAQLIVRAGSWRWVGLLVGLWNFIGLVLCLCFYKDPARVTPVRPKKEILREVDYIGGFLSTTGVLLFMMGMQWGASQYSWGSVHVLVPFIMGIVLIIGFFVWEFLFAKYPMAPRALFSRSPRTMTTILLITFFSGANFFVLLIFWPTQVYNVYGNLAAKHILGFQTDGEHRQRPSWHRYSSTAHWLRNHPRRLYCSRHDTHQQGQNYASNDLRHRPHDSRSVPSNFISRSPSIDTNPQ